MQHDRYLRGLQRLLSFAKSPDPAFRIEDLAIHLQDEASRLFSAAQQMRHAADREVPVVREQLLQNAARYEEYSATCVRESVALLESMPKHELEAFAKRNNIEAPNRIKAIFDRELGHE